MSLFPLFRRQHTSHSFAVAVLVTCALLGMIDSFYLVLEYIQVLLHPGEETPCTVNTLVSCTKTVQGSYAHYFPGIPNPMLGMLWYSGLLAYGAVRYLGADISRAGRMLTGVIILLGLAFSYRLYAASIFELRGVCPFCLLSTTLSTLIALAFIVDDRTYADAVVSNARRPFVYAFQIFSVALFVLYLPYFMIRGLTLIPEPLVALTHWSMPTIAILILIMAAAHITTYRALARH